MVPGDGFSHRFATRSSCVVRAPESTIPTTTARRAGERVPARLGVDVGARDAAVRPRVVEPPLVGELGIVRRQPCACRDIVRLDVLVAARGLQPLHRGRDRVARRQPRARARFQSARTLERSEQALVPLGLVDRRRASPASASRAPARPGSPAPAPSGSGRRPEAEGGTRNAAAASTEAAADARMPPDAEADGLGREALRQGGAFRTRDESGCAIVSGTHGRILPFVSQGRMDAPGRPRQVSCLRISSGG